MTSHGAAAAQAAARAVRACTGVKPRVGVILGSGLGGIAAGISGATTIPYRDVPGFPGATVVGHAGELVLGSMEGTPIAALSGRFHMYEGHDAALSAFGVRVLHALGATTLVVSNAAGAARADLQPGTIVVLRDQANLMFRNPLIGPLQDGDERFPDMSEPFDGELRGLAQRVAAERGIPLTEGVYFGVLGPSYETRAEVQMMARLGADVVGMSTVPEVIVARALGLRVLAFSCVTNHAAGLAATPITHEEVIRMTAKMSARLEQLLRATIANL